MTTELEYKIGEIHGAQQQILDIVSANRSAIVDQNKRIDAHRSQTLREFEENRQRIEDTKEEARVRIQAMESEMVKTKGVMKGIAWVITLVVPILTWALKKMEFI